MPQLGAQTGIHVAGLGMHAWGCLTPHAPGGVFKVCPVHHENVSGLVCSDCAFELKSADTDQEQAAACWSAIRARLSRLQHEGVDTSGAWMANAQFANRRGL